VNLEESITRNYAQEFNFNTLLDDNKFNNKDYHFYVLFKKEIKEVEEPLLHELPLYMSNDINS
jgi:hypothetical protein